MNFINGGGEEFSALLYPQQTNSTINYLKEQWNTMPISVTAVGNAFLEQGKKLSDKIMSSSALRRARDIVTKYSTNTLDDGYILPLESLPDLRAATLTMQRWNMANPTIKQLHIKQQCCGYSDTYVSNSLDTVGESDYDYRRVMHGLIVETPDDGYTLNHYIEPLYEEDSELFVDEQITILNNWSLMDLYVKEGKDPTSPYGDDL